MIEKILWTDSQCVIHWIKSKKLLSPFVQIRIDEIPASQNNYRYIYTHDNLADIEARDMDAAKLKEYKPGLVKLKNHGHPGTL